MQIDEHLMKQRIESVNELRPRLCISQPYADFHVEIFCIFKQRFRRAIINFKFENDVYNCVSDVTNLKMVCTKIRSHKFKSNFNASKIVKQKNVAQFIKKTTISANFRTKINELKFCRTISGFQCVTGICVKH